MREEDRNNVSIGHHMGQIDSVSTGVIIRVEIRYERYEGKGKTTKILLRHPLLTLITNYRLRATNR